MLGDLDNSRPTQNAYVVFRDKDAAESAVVANMQLVEGRHIRVDRLGEDGAAVEYDAATSVFLGNLPFDIEVGDGGWASGLSGCDMVVFCL